MHEEARYQRAKALARLKLGHSALAGFDEILDHGPGSRFYTSAMEWLFYVGRGLANEQPLMSRVARHGGEGVPPIYEDRVSYLLAKYEFDRGRALADAGRTAEAKSAWGDARRLAAKVGAKPPVSFFAYPGKASWCSPDGCRFAQLGFRRLRAPPCACGPCCPYRRDYAAARTFTSLSSRSVNLSCSCSRS